MNAYRVQVGGLNYYLEMENQVQRCGFYTTVWVEADDSDSAQLIALEQVENRSELKAISRNAESDPPSLRVDDLSALESYEEFGENQGFSFFKDPLKKWWQFWK